MGNEIWFQKPKQVGILNAEINDTSNTINEECEYIKLLKQPIQQPKVGLSWKEIEEKLNYRSWIREYHNIRLERPIY
jgi:hypothetical protein